MLQSLGNRQNMFSLSCHFLSMMLLLFLWVMVYVGNLPQVFAQNPTVVVGSPETASRSPLDIVAEQVEFDRKTEAFLATGSVVVTQGALRLTAEQATIKKLTGVLIAKGKVHLIDQTTDVWAEEMEINVYTEAGIITNGKIFLHKTKSWISGRLLQRFSETHLRAKDGTFTNCDADDGQIPDWSFEFEDVDLEQGDSVFAKNMWLRVRNQRVLPLPILRYPMPGARKTGFLIPTAGYDNVLGFQYRQDFFWALSPSQDLLITPWVISERGFGGDLTYRYIFSRQSRGNWLISSLYDNEVDKRRSRITGRHAYQAEDDLRMTLNIDYSTDRTLLQDLTSSGIYRALPSQQSLLSIAKRLPRGEVALEAQYLQPLNAGGKRTFQRFPQIFHRYTGGSSDGTFVIDLNSQFVHFWREKGFHISRLALMPNISTQGLHLGHIVGLRPQAKLREILYSHGRTSSQESFRERGTVWLGFEAVSSLSRRFFLGQGHRLRHSIKPSLFYEYVPKTEQADLAQVDALDNFPNKNLMTYSLNTSFRDEWSGGISTTLLDLTLAQSYHLGVSPGQATSFSDIWGRATVGLPTTQFLPFISIATVSFDTFFDPGKGEFSQFNYDINLQAKETAYIKIGRRHTRIGTVPRRGDIWNPLSFNEVFAPTSEIDFLTIGGAIRTPFGWTIGSQIYRDVINEVTPEWDVVALYQNPCRCWSFALYYIELGEGGGLPERNQFNFALTLRGVGATEGNRTELLKSILGPILGNESGLPWSIN